MKNVCLDSNGVSLKSYNEAVRMKNAGLGSQGVNFELKNEEVRLWNEEATLKKILSPELTAAETSPYRPHFRQPEYVHPSSRVLFAFVDLEVVGWLSPFFLQV